MLYVILGGVAAFIVALVLSPAFREYVRGLKTMLVAIVIAIGGVLEQFDLTTVVPRDEVGYYLLGIAVVMAILRLVTTGPVKGA